MSRFFPKLDDSATHTQSEQKFKLWYDPDGSEYKIPAKTVAPDTDDSADLRARDYAMSRSVPFEYNNSTEKREVLIEPEDTKLTERLRRNALAEARMKMLQEEVNDPEREEKEPEPKFNMNGSVEASRRYDSLGIRVNAAEPAQSRPRPAVDSLMAQTEHIAIPDDKSVSVLKSVFRNLTADPGSKPRTEQDQSRKAELDKVVRAVLDSGFSKPWTPPETLSRPMKPDAVAYGVGKRALETIQAFKTVPELKNLSVKERDELMVSIGRTMLNVAIVGPTAPKTMSKHTENSPLSNDSVRRKILASIHPEVMKKALGPELLQLSLKDAASLNQVRAPEGTKPKSTPDTLHAIVNKERSVGRLIEGEYVGSTQRTPGPMTDEQPRKHRTIWNDPHLA
jgi:hypothetical protein